MDLEAKYRRVLGGFSINDDRQFVNDSSELAKITVNWSNVKKVKFNLYQSMELADRKDFNLHRTEKLDHFLKWILANMSIFPLSPPNFPDNSEAKEVDVIQSLGTDFVTHRGMFRKVMQLPYAGDSATLLAVKFSGSIYVLKLDDDGGIQGDASLFYSLGHKFNHFLEDGTDPTEGQKEQSNFNSVIYSELGQHSLLYLGEVDAYDPTRCENPNEASDLSDFLELKTARELGQGFDRMKRLKTLELHKFRDWWSQSYMSGTGRILCGFRDDDWVVNSVKIYEVDEFLQAGRKYWSKSVILKTLDDFLTWTKNTFDSREDGRVYKITCTSQGGRRPSRVHFTDEPSSETFLPEWFTEEFALSLM